MNIHVYTNTHMHEITKEGMYLKECREGSMGSFGERKGKGKNIIKLQSQKIIRTKTKQTNIQ